MVVVVVVEVWVETDKSGRAALTNDTRLFSVDSVVVSLLLPTSVTAVTEDEEDTAQSIDASTGAVPEEEEDGALLPLLYAEADAVTVTGDETGGGVTEFDSRFFGWCW